MALIHSEDAISAVFELASRNLVHSTSSENILADWRAQTKRSSQGRSIAQNCTCSGSACSLTEASQELVLWLELAEDCNLDCVFCYNPWRPAESAMRDRPKLDPEELNSALDAIFMNVQVGHVVLSGGEPLLYPDLVRLTKSLRSRCPSIGLTTNGRSLTSNRAAALALAGVTRTSIPVHSLNEKEHDELAGARSWRSAIRAVVFSLATGVEVTISSVVTARNFRQIVGVSRIAAELGVSSVILNSFHAVGQGSDRQDLELDSEEFLSVVELTRQAVGESVEVLIGSPHVQAGSSKSGVDRIVISPYGDLKFCNQSTKGVINFKNDLMILSQLLSCVRLGNYETYLTKVDNCTCRDISGSFDRRR